MRAIMIEMPKLSETDIKKAAIDYLQYGQNQGKWVFLRLNAGDFVVLNKDGSHRMIKGCPKGTADILILTNNGRYDAPNKFYCIPIFIELKSKTGKQSKEQKEFQGMVEAQGATYIIIRSVERLMEVLP